MINSSRLLSLVTLATFGSASAFSIVLKDKSHASTPAGRATSPLYAAEVEASSTAQQEQQHWMDFLKFDGAPTFDVVEKTKQYVSEPGYKRFALREIPNEYYDEERYIFRGPIVGPINRQDLVRTNTIFGLDKAFPDLDRQCFGFAADPENPYRVMFFERWKATHTGEVSILNLPPLPPTGKTSVSPAFTFSIVWTPEGKIIYESLGTAIDRFEPNTSGGKVAVFGLLETAGLPLPNNVGDLALRIQQGLFEQSNPDNPNVPHVWSSDANVPDWWKSASRGAGPTDT